MLNAAKVCRTVCVVKEGDTFSVLPIGGGFQQTFAGSSPDVILSSLPSETH